MRSEGTLNSDFLLCFGLNGYQFIFRPEVMKKKMKRFLKSGSGKAIRGTLSNT